MVDEVRLHQPHYRSVSESSRSDDIDDYQRGGSTVFDQQSLSEQRPGKSRKQNIRELREDFEVDPDLYGIRRSERSRREPPRFELQADRRPMNSAHQPHGQRLSESNSNEDDDDESESSSDSSSNRAPAYRSMTSGRFSGRTRGCRVNYKSAFVDNESDSDDAGHPYPVGNKRTRQPNNVPRAQQAMLQKPRGPLIRISGKASERFPSAEEVKHPDTSDADSYAAHPSHLSDDSTADDSRPPIQTGYAGINAADEEVDVIEDILSHAIRRAGATGNPTTLYNCRLEYDPNEGFDVAKEKGEMMYLIKWRSWSHIHSTWETEDSLTSPDRGCAVDGLKRLYAYQSTMKERVARERFANRDELEAMVYEDERNDVILSEKMEVDRIVAHSRDKEQGSFDYLCKWCRLDYRFCTWESGRVIQYLYPDAIRAYKSRCESATLPNLRHEYLRNRPRFIRLLEQPDYIGAGNPELRMRDYQLKGLNWIAHAWTRGNSVILADEMGLGKTLQAVSFLSYLFHEHNIHGPFLVVVPLSTICSWQKELETWAPQMNAIVYVGDHISRQFIRENEWSLAGVGGGRRQQLLKFNVCVTTYEILLKDKSWLGQVQWAVLAVDEAHRLKNDASQLYKTLFAFDTNTRLLITGTPLQNSLKELWSLLHFLMPSTFEDWEVFEGHYSLNGHGRSGDSYEAIRNLHRALEPFLLRRVKKDVEQSLPAKTEQILRVEMSKKQSTIYRLILARNYDGLMKVTHGHKTSFINIVMELKKCCNHANLIAPPSDEELYSMNREHILREITRGSGKLMLLDKLLQKLKPQGHRVLIFSQMVRMLDIIADYLQLRGWGFQRLDGSIRGELRKQALDHFNAEGSTDFCFLLSTRAGGLGVNLATADTVVIFDSDWNPQNDIQAQARAHRIGQTKQVSVYRLVVKDSVEEKIIESATRKMLLDHLVIQRMDSSGNRIAGPNRKADTRSQVLTEILRHGTESLFKSDEEAAEVEVDIDDILNRAETRDADTEVDLHNPANALLSTFSVVTLDQLEEDDVKPVQIDPSGKYSKSWSEIIPESMREKVKQDGNQDALLDLELGPRRRRQVKTFQAGMDNYEPSESSSPDSDQETTKRPTVAKFSDKEIRALIRAVKRFARPLERIDAIAAEAELPDRTSYEVREVIDAVIKGCKAAMESLPDDSDKNSKQKGPIYYYGKFAVAAKPLLQSLGHLEILYKALPSTSKEARLNYELPFHPKMVNWPNAWSTKDDVRLLVGVFEHGYDNWEAIKLDPDLGLGSKLLPLAASERPQASHIRARVDYLIKTLDKNLPKVGGEVNEGTASFTTADNKRGRHGHHERVSKASNNKSKHAKRTSSKSGLSNADSSHLIGSKPKSAEFVNSEDDEDSSDSDGEAGADKNGAGGLVLKIKKTATKRAFKSKATDDGEMDDLPPRKKAKKRPAKPEEPQHFTAHREPVSISKSEEEEFHQMRGPLFDKCKQKLHPIKKLFKQLEQLENECAPNGDQFDRVILGIGEHVRSLVNDIEGRDERHTWRRLYWEFVQNFSEKDAQELQAAYRHARKKLSKEHPPVTNSTEGVKSHRETPLSREQPRQQHDRRHKSGSHSGELIDQRNASSTSHQHHRHSQNRENYRLPNHHRHNRDSPNENDRHRHRSSSGRHGNSSGHSRYSPSGRVPSGSNNTDWSSSSRRSLNNNSSYDRPRHLGRDEWSGTAGGYNNSDRYDNAFNRPAHGFNSAYSQHPAFSRPPQESASSIPPPCQPPPHLPISVSWQQPQSMHLPAAASSIIPPPISPMVLNQPPQPPTSASRLSSNSSTFSIGRDPRLHPSASSRH